jgi:hypothetical protein
MDGWGFSGDFNRLMDLSWEGCRGREVRGTRLGISGVGRSTSQLKRAAGTAGIVNVCCGEVWHGHGLVPFHLNRVQPSLVKEAC